MANKKSGAPGVPENLIDMGDGTWARKVVVVNADNTTAGGGVVADGADVTQGAVADAVVAAGAAGTLSAKLRRLTADLAALNALLGGGLPAALGTGGGLK